MQKISQIIAFVGGLGVTFAQAQETDGQRIADIIDTTVHATTFVNSSVERTAYDKNVATFREKQIAQEDGYKKLKENNAVCGTPMQIGALKMAMGGYLFTLGTDVKYRSGLTSLGNQLDLAESCANLAAMAYTDSNISEAFVQSLVGQEVMGHDENGEYGVLRIIDRAEAEGRLAYKIQELKADAEAAREYKKDLGPALELRFDK